MLLIKKIKENLWILRSLHKTLYLNFKCLPFKQAIKLPILLYKPKILCLKGKIKIKAEHIKTGMIQLGTYEVNIYPNCGITIDIRGKLIFEGVCKIGNSSNISITENAETTLGNNFAATAALKFVNYDKISIGSNVLIGWDCLICDYDFHTITNILENKEYSKKGKIKIGNKVWIANGCSIMKNSEIPANTIVAAHSLINKKINVPEYSLIAGIPATIKRNNVKWEV